MPHQAEELYDTQTSKVWLFGRRSGKTYTGALWLYKALQEAVVNQGVEAKPRVAYISPTQSAARAFLVDQMIPLLDQMEIPYKASLSITNLRLDFDFGGAMLFFSMSNNGQQARGLTLSAIFLDEAQELDFEDYATAVLPTLATTGGPVRIAGTPKLKTSLLREACYHYPVRRIKTIDAGLVKQEDLDFYKQSMTKQQFAQEFEGVFVVDDSVVYNSFDRKLSVGEYSYDPSLPLYVGADFNVSNAVWVVGQLKGKDQIHIIDEIRLDDSRTDLMLLELQAKYPDVEPNDVIFVCDPSGNSRKSSSGGSTDFSLIHDAGFKNHSAKKAPNLNNSIQHTNVLLKNSDNSTSIFIDKSCRHLINDFESVCWNKNKTATDKSDIRLTHASDSFRYLVWEKLPKRTIPKLTTSRVNVYL